MRVPAHSFLNLKRQALHATAHIHPPDSLQTREPVPQLICSPQTGSFLSRVFRAILPWLGGAENDEGIEVFGCAEGIYSEAGG